MKNPDQQNFDCCDNVSISKSRKSMPLSNSRLGLCCLLLACVCNAALAEKPVTIEFNSKKPVNSGWHLKFHGWHHQDSDAKIPQTDEGFAILSSSKAGNPTYMPWVDFNTHFDPHKDFSVEFRMKLLSAPKGSEHGVSVLNGRYEELILIKPGEVRLETSGVSVPLDTKKFHTYRFEATGFDKYRQAKGILYVDSKEVAKVNLAKSNINYEWMTFGCLSRRTPTSGIWDYVKLTYFPLFSEKNGSVTFDSLDVIRLHPEDLSFIYAHKRTNGTIWLGHAIGLHGVTERGGHLMSPDNGKTWGVPKQPQAFGSCMNMCEFPDGSTMNIEAWSSKPVKAHEITVIKWNKSGNLKERKSWKSKITLPMETSFHLHRDLIRFKDGRLVACGYGTRKGKSKSWSFVIESKDEGKTWSYLGQLGWDPNIPGEGLNEPCIVELADGSILCLMRTDGRGMHGRGPLMQVKSKDGGKTWSKPVQVASNGVCPDIVRLANGALVAVAGRDGVYVLIDYTGTGDNWIRYDIYNGTSSANAAVVEYEPSKVMIIYDESEFCGQRGPGLLNRIVALKMTVKKTKRQSN